MTTPFSQFTQFADLAQAHVVDNLDKEYFIRIKNEGKIDFHTASRIYKQIFGQKVGDHLGKPRVVSLVENGILNSFGSILMKIVDDGEETWDYPYYFVALMKTNLVQMPSKEEVKIELDVERNYTHVKLPFEVFDRIFEFCELPAIFVLTRCCKLFHRKVITREFWFRYYVNYHKLRSIQTFKEKVHFQYPRNFKQDMLERYYIETRGCFEEWGDNYHIDLEYYDKGDNSRCLYFMLHTLGSCVNGYPFDKPNSMFAKLLPIVRRYLYGGVDVLEFLGALRYLGFYTDRLYQQVTAKNGKFDGGYPLRRICKHLFDSNSATIFYVFSVSGPMILFRWLFQHEGSYGEVEKGRYYEGGGYRVRRFHKFRKFILEEWIGSVYAKKILPELFEEDRMFDFFRKAGKAVPDFSPMERKMKLIMKLAVDHLSFAHGYFMCFAQIQNRICWQFLMKNGFFDRVDYFQILRYFVGGHLLSGCKQNDQRYGNFLILFSSLIEREDAKDRFSEVFLRSKMFRRFLSRMLEVDYRLSLDLNEMVFERIVTLLKEKYGMKRVQEAYRDRKIVLYLLGGEQNLSRIFGGRIIVKAWKGGKRPMNRLSDTAMRKRKEWKHELAITEFKKGNYEIAMERFMEEIRMILNEEHDISHFLYSKEPLSEATSLSRQEVGTLCGNIAECLIQLHRYSEALEYIGISERLIKLDYDSLLYAKNQWRKFRCFMNDKEDNELSQMLYCFHAFFIAGNKHLQNKMNSTPAFKEFCDKGSEYLSELLGFSYFQKSCGYIFSSFFNVYKRMWEEESGEEVSGYNFFDGFKKGEGVFSSKKMEDLVLLQESLADMADSFDPNDPLLREQEAVMFEKMAFVGQYGPMSVCLGHRMLSSDKDS